MIIKNAIRHSNLFFINGGGLWFAMFGDKSYKTVLDIGLSSFGGCGTVYNDVDVYRLSIEVYV